MIGDIKRLLVFFSVLASFSIFASPAFAQQYQTTAAKTTNVGNPVTAVAATSNTCLNSSFHQKYLSNFQNNTIFSPKNFGDPTCDYSLDALVSYLTAHDPKYEKRWYAVIIPGESGYDPNAEQLNDPYDPAHAWGLVQMGRGKNGPLDHGDVYWKTQIQNAIDYNTMLNKDFVYVKDVGTTTTPLTWTYWSTASQWWHQPL